MPPKDINLPVIPSGYRVVDGQYLQKIKRSRKKFKTPLAVRKKMARAARSFKLPVLTTGANLPWMGKFMEVMSYNQGGWKGLRRASEQVLLPAFTGVHIDSTGKTTFNLSNLKMGLVPNLAVMGVKKTRVLQGLNRAIARTGLPARLN